MWYGNLSFFNGQCLAIHLCMRLVSEATVIVVTGLSDPVISTVVLPVTEVIMADTTVVTLATADTGTDMDQDRLGI